MDRIEQRVLDAVDMDGLLAFLCELIGVASLDGTPEEITIQERVADTMRAVEPPSLEEFVSIWYSDATRRELQKIRIRD